MAINIELKNFPTNKTIFGLIKDSSGRKKRIEDYINGVKTRFPSLQTKVDDFWTTNQTKFDSLSDASDTKDWEVFFEKFARKIDLVNSLANTEALKEFDVIFQANSSDNDLVSVLKDIAKDKKDNVNTSFDNTKGVDWFIFVLDTFKQFYLVELPNQINSELTNKGKTFAQLQGGAKDLFKLKSCFDKSFEILYTSFEKTEDEPNLDTLVDDTNKNLKNISAIIGSVGTASGSGDDVDIAKLKITNSKLKEFAKWQTKYIKGLVELLYGFQQNASTITPTPSPQPNPNPVPDNNQPKPQPTPTPQPTPQPAPEPGKDPWENSGLSGTILASAKNNYQPNEIVGGKYQNIPLTTGDATEKNNIFGWRQAFPSNNPPYNEFNLGDVDNQGKYKGQVIGTKTKSQIEDEIIWNNFFTAHKITPTQQSGWKNTGFNPTESETALNNGWGDPFIIQNKIIASYSSEGQTSSNINPLIIKKADKDKEHQQETKRQQETAKAKQVLAQIGSTTDENKLPDDDAIRGSYEDVLLDTTLKYDQVIKAKNDKRLEILKAKELKKYTDILDEINSPTRNTFKTLPENYASDRINALDNALLPSDKQRETLTQAIKDKRATFFYVLTDIDPNGDMEGKGIASDTLTLAEQATSNVWEIRDYDPLTPEILNEALNACEGIDGLASGGEDDGQSLDDDGKGSSFLKDLKGYRINDVEPGVEEKEAKLPKETRGTFLLPLFYKMNNYYYKNPEFCQWVKVKKWNADNTKEIDVVVLIDTTTKDDVENPDNPKKFTEASLTKLKEIFAQGIKGQWAIGTGVGKTTKSMNCLLYMLKQNFPNG